MIRKLTKTQIHQHTIAAYDYCGACSCGSCSCASCRVSPSEMVAINQIGSSQGRYQADYDGPETTVPGR